MKRVDSDTISSLLPYLDGYRFTSKDFVNVFAEHYPKYYQDVIAEYGKGGRGSGRHYSANVHLAQSLSSCADLLGIQRLGSVKATPDWGHQDITLWECDTKGTGTIPIERSVEKDICDIISNPNIDITEKKLLTSARIGQGHFRKNLIQYWGGCAVTGCNDFKLLVASHIKPWSRSDSRERLDTYNGLLLIPNLDRLFDQGLISFNEKGQLLISKSLGSSNLDILGVNEKMTVTVKEEHKPYLEYHRKYLLI